MNELLIEDPTNHIFYFQESDPIPHAPDRLVDDSIIATNKAIDRFEKQQAELCQNLDDSTIATNKAIDRLEKQQAELRQNLDDATLSLLAMIGKAEIKSEISSEDSDAKPSIAEEPDVEIVTEEIGLPDDECYSDTTHTLERIARAVADGNNIYEWQMHDAHNNTASVPSDTDLIWFKDSATKTTLQMAMKDGLYYLTQYDDHSTVETLPTGQCQYQVLSWKADGINDTWQADWVRAHG